MELAEFTPIAKHIIEGESIDVRFGDGAAFSLPVAVRREGVQYDAMFLYRRTPASAQARRPFAWILLDACANRVSLFCRCDLVDFMPAGMFPPGCPLTMAEQEELSDKKRTSCQDKLLAAYEEIRRFVFSENLTRAQASAVATYKEMFKKLINPAHYPFYHGLSPAFFHWLRMPLPAGALEDPARSMGELQKDGYQLLILENLQQLVRQFQDKIATDQHKEKLFDEMHRELQDYKNGLIGSLTLSLERDVIQAIDNVGKSVEAFRKREGTAEDYHRLLALLAGVETDLTDLLYRHGVEPYSEERVDVHRQKIVHTVATADPGLDKTVAARIAPGWEKEGRVVRPERISVYVYRAGEEGTANEEESQ